MREENQIRDRVKKGLRTSHKPHRNMMNMNNVIVASDVNWS